MTAINFPDSPSNGDTHVVGGVTYTYDSTETKWKTTINSNAFLPLTGGTVSGNIVLGGEIQHDGDTDTKLHFDTDTIKFDTAGSERFRVGSAGQLGIGGATYGTSGQVLTSQGSGSAPQWATPAGGLFDAAAILSDVKGDNVNGGQFNAGAWRTRDLNTEVDPSGIVTLSSNNFTLGTGTYYIRWAAPAYNVNKNNTKLRNTTNGVNVGYGNTAHAWVSANNTTRSEGAARVVVSGNTTFQIQHYGAATDFQGFGNSGYESSVFTVVEIFRYA